MSEKQNRDHHIFRKKPSNVSLYSYCSECTSYNILQVRINTLRASKLKLIALLHPEGVKKSMNQTKRWTLRKTFHISVLRQYGHFNTYPWIKVVLPTATQTNKQPYIKINIRSIRNEYNSQITHRYNRTWNQTRTDQQDRSEETYSAVQCCTVYWERTAVLK